MSDILQIPFGTRNVGWWTNRYGNQIPVKTRKDIYDFIDEYLGVANIGISVCVFKDCIPYLLFLPFDFDSTNLREAWVDAKKLYEYLYKGRYDIHMTFSGRKGFHVYLGVEPKPYSRKQIKGIQRYFKDKLKLKTMDEQIFGDIRRLLRIPYTFNINGGLCKEIINHEGDLLDLDNLLIESQYKNYETVYESKGFHKYECIENIIRSDPEPRHLIRYCYVILRLDEGFSEGDIIEEMRTFDWKDFDEEYSRRQIQHIDQGNYYPLSCKSLKELGYCIKDCEFINDDLEEVGIR